MDGDTLDVYLYGEHIGVITEGKTLTNAVFEYSDRASQALSLSLPLDGSFDAVQTRNWFIGLLPEDPDRLSALAKRFGVVEKDYVGILRGIESEFSGAVSFRVPLAPELPVTGVEAGILGVAKHLPSITAEVPNEALHSAVAGFQPKFTAARSRNTFIVPTDHSLTTHIIKPSNPRWDKFVEAEAWAMKVAESVTSTAETSIEVISGILVLVSKRFDRVLTGTGVVHAIHQEDFNQSLGLDNEQKYAHPAGNPKITPSYKKLAEILNEHALRPEEELEKLASQMVVRIVIGDTDAHAKNFGLLYTTYNAVSLSPMYDVIPVTHFLPKDLKFSMSVNMKFRHDRVKFKDILAEVKSWGVDGEAALRWVDRALNNAAVGIDLADVEIPDRPDGVKDIASMNLAKIVQTRVIL